MLQQKTVSDVVFLRGARLNLFSSILLICRQEEAGRLKGKMEQLQQFDADVAFRKHFVEV